VIASVAAFIAFSAAAFGNPDFPATTAINSVFVKACLLLKL
jgi:hypothetical protein